jgi:hypothetical protein
MSSNAFAIQGNTVALAVTSTAHSAVQIDAPTNGPGNINFVVCNIGTSLGYISYAPPGPGNSAPSPTLAAVIPTDGTPANGYPVLAGSKETITAPPGSYWSAICASGLTTTITVTPGEGV